LVALRKAFSIKQPSHTSRVVSRSSRAAGHRRIGPASPQRVLEALNTPSPAWRRRTVRLPSTAPVSRMVTAGPLNTRRLDPHSSYMDSKSPARPRSKRPSIAAASAR
jgi:hypothetical protein